MKKAIITIIIIAIVVLGGYFIFSGTYQKTSMPAEEQPNSQSLLEQTQTNETNVITYTDAGYSPSALEIKAGETVAFKNESSQLMWPASSMHPAHKDYPTTGGCLGSTFDACMGVQPGDSWSFKFDIAGNWKYHDHLSPKNFGAINVK
ncbi:MAG: Plastocyanin [Parcubacteria group bacterium GW2011_GWB1_43_8]|nr:MAG: Plastocyanin [Parcubacteria group bacterium GW2011_GWB1_43_8]